MSQYRIAFIDIENSPNVSYTWGKWQQDVIAFTREWYIMSFSVKWNDEKRTRTYALPDFPLYKTDPHNDRDLVREMHKVLSEADLIVAHNGDAFDLKKTNTRFIFHGLTPPSPYKTVDTLKIARKCFAFNSNRLDDIAKFLGVGNKLKTGGFELWEACLKGDLSAWRKMKRYNTRDVVILERVYERVRAWHPTHPNVNVNSDDLFACPGCSSRRVQRRGWEALRSWRVRRYQCLDCGKWSRGAREKRDNSGQEILT